MSLIEQLGVNKKLPYSSAYKEHMERVEFLRVSYKADGINYTSASAPDGKIIHKLECEEPGDYRSRVNKTPVRSYVSSIVNKYNSAVFKNEPSRTTEVPTYEELYWNADGYGTPLNDLMRKALLRAQIDGTSYLLADSTESTTEILTIAQKLASDARPYIRIIPVESVIQVFKVEENLLEAIILLEDEAGHIFARWMNDTSFIDMELNKDRITSISEPYAHGYDGIPLVEIKPFEDAQSQPVAYSQRTIVNILSLLNMELNDSVFTKWILSGTRVDDEDNKKISWSGKRLIVIEDVNAKISQLGAEHGCADSLRKEIDIEETSMYYSAGFGKPNVEPTNLSGISRLIALEDFFISCRALTQAIESAENKVMQLIADKEGYEYTDAVYSQKYIADDNGEALQSLRDLLALNLPATFKALAVQDYINRFYNLSDEQMKKIEQELLTSGENGA